MNYIIFDDEKWQDFLPLTYLRSTCDLRVGILKLRQRLNAFLNSDSNRIVISDHLKELYRERHPDWQINHLEAGEMCFINSRLKITSELVEQIDTLAPESCITQGSQILACKVVAQAGDVSSDDLSDLFSGLKNIEMEGDLLWKSLWELIAENGKLIEQDFQDFFYDKDNHYETELGITVLNPSSRMV